MASFLSTHHVFLGAAAIIVLLALAQFLGRFVIAYRLEERALIFRLFHVFPVMTVLYEDIEEPQLKSARRAPSSMRGIRMSNRLIGRGIVMGKRTGIYSSITFTPSDPEAFLAALNEKRRLAPRD